MLADTYERLARICLKRPWLILLAWLLVAVVGSMGAKRVQSVLNAEQAIAGSASAQVEARLTHEFDNPYTFPAYVAVTGSAPVGSEASDKALGALQKALAASPAVGQTLSYLDGRLSLLGQPYGDTSVIVAGLQAKTRREAADLIPQVREAIATGLIEARRHDPALQVHVTGDAAINHDMVKATSQDAKKAEARAIPLTLLLLVIVFGSLVAACLPLLVAIVGSLVSMGIIYAVGQWLPLSGFVVSIATMMGLGVGTNSGLFLVSRFREERAAGLSPREAATATLRTTGVAVTYSSLTVMLGFAVMLLVPVADIRSVGLGGLVEVGVCTLFALTALPAVLTILGDWLESPRWLGRVLNRWKRPAAWAAWSDWVMARPLTCLAAGLVPLLLMAAPMAGIRIGLPDLKWVPAELESSKGAIALQALPRTNDTWSLQVLVTAPAGQSILSSERVDGLFQLAEHLQQQTDVVAVRALTNPPGDLPAWQVRWQLADPESAKQRFPDMFRLFVSRDGSTTQLTVIPKHDISVADGVALTRTVRAIDLRQFDGLADASLAVGGRLGFAIDFQEALMGPFPAIIGLVLAITGLMLLAAFRSYLLPVKALILNGLSVLATFGLLVLVFQWGYGSSLLGVSQGPTDVVIVAVPVLVFCIVFGLSMDYEVLMLSRIREAYEHLQDNRIATGKGLEATGSLITSAALIMAIAFGSFVTADLITLKMLGFGLTAAVLLDATVIRILLVPAFMRLAGRWNWYPGRPASGDKSPERSFASSGRPGV